MMRRHRALVAAGFPYLVAQSAGELLGYAYAGAYRARPAYRWTVEDSVYVAPHAHRRGVGGALLRRLIEASETDGYRQMIAVIGDSANVASIELHRALGFDLVGTLANTGFKFGRWLDTVLMQRSLGAGAARRRQVSCALIHHQTSELSRTRSTRSSSWPRLRISPVAEITL